MYILYILYIPIRLSDCLHVLCKIYIHTAPISILLMCVPVELIINLYGINFAYFFIFNINMQTLSIFVVVVVVVHSYSVLFMLFASSK